MPISKLKNFGSIKMNWIPKLQDALQFTKGLLQERSACREMQEYGWEACGIADMGTLSGAVNFHQQCVRRHKAHYWVRV